MDLKERISIHLDQIKRLKGVENAVLTQRDGNPIQSSGIWFSKEEIFNVSSSTSAIFNVGIHLYDDLKYILLEGKKAKIMIAPLNMPLLDSLDKILEKHGILNDNHKFFIGITAQSHINLGGMLLQTKECLAKIKATLLSSGKSFEPPLIEFNKERKQALMEGFNVKENIESEAQISTSSLNISNDISNGLSKTLKNFSVAIPDLNYAFITVEGGFITSKIIKTEDLEENDFDSLSAMTYSLFQTANKCSWLMKKMLTDSLLIDCGDSYLFIFGLKKATLCANIKKSRQKLGLIRLILPQFKNRIESLLLKASETVPSQDFDFNGLFGNLVLEKGVRRG